MPPKRKSDKKEDPLFVEEEGSYVHEKELARYVGGVRRATGGNFRCRHGRGVFKSPVIRYEGDWNEDEMHGSGELRFLATGDVYRGQFAHGMFEGTGTYIWASGSSYEGAWRANRMHGLGTYTDVNGKVWNGKFYNGTGPGLTPFAGGACIMDRIAPAAAEVEEEVEEAQPAGTPEAGELGACGT
ncbi:central apparatus associated protein C1a-18 [Trypanosoma rangeli]|uniref:Central apparatus associated protein C1a-18 n=1 Tax=Trypanosoma rangeli TaxID=5698 RepID=A0A3R7KKB6_TRYRA|nr:central apparatus associated protein C1a-18 [Trypanosoma rangeli]RNF08189.1 central apparatus associated protein C1a-18 [Trypanosoma rangeli]|eukprot:RNF08189.1 central apparatus associated protein C1a-18 [Trypanosoma rangeli]